MKYCTECEMNLGNVDLLEKEGKTFCPRCEQNEVMEITTKKLNDLVNNITEAFYNIKETSVQNNAQQLIQNARVIENGEKRLKKEFMKREKQLKEVQYELAVIKKIADKLNYNMEG